MPRPGGEWDLYVFNYFLSQAAPKTTWLLHPPPLHQSVFYIENILEWQVLLKLLGGSRN